MKRIAVAIVLGLVASAARGEDAARAVFSVFVRTAEIEFMSIHDDWDALKLRREQARQNRRRLENELRELYGSGRKSWPAERKDELFRLVQEEALADADYEYRKSDPRVAYDTAREIAESFQEKHGASRAGAVVLASSAAEADLVVEVAACRTAKSFPTQSKPDRCYVLFTVGAGGHLDPTHFARVPADYRIKKFGTRAWRIAGPTLERPVFHFESYNGGGKEFGCPSAAAHAASAAVDKFIEDNYGVLTAH
ncbi:MAG TPA: hypothetical protein VFS78_17475 [Vicinamibacteria bacterium]|nr:hypothetical protein [Vicinamibacteria bacterium]